MRLMLIIRGKDHLWTEKCDGQTTWRLPILDISVGRAPDYHNNSAHCVLIDHCMCNECKSESILVKNTRCY